MSDDSKPAILLVDDNARNLEALAANLSSNRELSIVRATSGPDALRQVLRRDFAVILLDVQMPGMDGFETAAAIRARQRSRNVPIIFVTAIDKSETHVSKGYELGAVDFVFKPVMPSILRAKVDAFVNLFLTTQALARSEARLLELNETLEQQVVQRTEALQARNEEIQAISQQLWQAAKLATMGELAASMAHEINNPLATIGLRAEWLLDQTQEDDPRRRSLEVIEQEVQRISNLTGGFLQFSRHSSRQVSTLSISEEIGRTLDLVNHHLRKRHIAITSECASETPMIQADREQLRQVFLNLFTNASDAMPDGGTLTVRVSPCGDHDAGEDAKSSIAVTVSDTGTGIQPGILARIGEPFFTTKPEGKGTGLGFSICRRIVQEHGGTIVIQSEVGKGTTVSITLPVAVRNEQEPLVEQTCLQHPDTMCEAGERTLEQAALSAKGHKVHEQ